MDFANCLKHKLNDFFLMLEKKEQMAICFKAMIVLDRDKIKTI